MNILKAVGLLSFSLMALSAFAEDLAVKDLCLSEPSITESTDGKFSYMIGAGPDGAQPNAISTGSEQVLKVLSQAAADISDKSPSIKICLSGASTEKVLVVTQASLKNLDGSAVQLTDPCENARSQVQIGQCFGAQFQAADTALNLSYQALVGYYKNIKANGDIETLTKAEKAWINFRDLECAFQSFDSSGGQMDSIDFVACKTDLSKARTKQLQDKLAENNNR